MARKKQDRNIDQGIGNVEEALSKSEQFIEKHHKTIIYIIGSVLLLILVIYAYGKYIAKPKEKRAQKSIYVAQKYFSVDSFNLALQGDGSYDGFLGVIGEYGNTKTGNLAKYYAGICYRELGNYEEAIGFLEDFSPKGFHLSSLKYAAIGDCNLELGNLEDAVVQYKKASLINPNFYSTPVYLLRAGFVYEKLQDFENALKMFKKIERDYPHSIEARDIQKYITRVKMKMRNK